MKDVFKTSIILLAILLNVSAGIVPNEESNLYEIFQQYVIDNDRPYKNDQTLMQIFFRNFVTNYYKAISVQQQCPACGINLFSDQNPYYQPGTGALRSQQNNFQEQGNLRKATLVNPSTISAPTSFDWRNYGVITSVKNQGDCGNCWSFSTAAFFESQLVRRKLADSTINLAEQYFFQCDNFSKRCDGGYLQSAMDLALNSNRIPYQAQFPFNPFGRYQKICQADSVATFPNGSNRLTYVNGLSDNEIITLLLQRPLNIGVVAKNWKFYDPTKNITFSCPQNVSNYQSIDHTVLLVGYNQNQWIIKNQWSQQWGIGGYIYVARGDDKDCAIGWEVHTLDFKLDPVNIIAPVITNNAQNNSNQSQINQNPTNTRIQTPLAVTCPLPNCDNCYYQSSDCNLCKNGYQLNIVTKQCIQQKIPNCLQVKFWANKYECTKCKQNFNLISGACAIPGFNPPLIQANNVIIVDPFSNIPSSYFTTNTTCTLKACEICFNNGKDCLWCIPGYGINQRNGICEISPIANCNLFYSVNTDSNCFQCQRGYKLQGNSACIKN